MEKEQTRRLELQLADKQRQAFEARDHPGSDTATLTPMCNTRR